MSRQPTEWRALVDQLNREAAASRQPVNGTFELTERCNLACRMCYIRQPAGDPVHRSGELTARQWLDLARAAVDQGMLFLLLTGGEPLLRPDFFDIYTPLARMGLLLTLFTNGTLITDDVAARLADAPPSRTEITLYGATRETYEGITGVPGSYDRCLAGIEALVRRDIPLGLKSTITRRNVTELDAMRKMAHGWGRSFSAGWLLTPRREDGPSDVEACRLSAQECVALEATDRASADQWTEAALRGDSAGKDHVNFYCMAGKAAFAMNARGEMNPCIDLRLPAAQPLETGFAAAWEAVQNFVDSAPPLARECLQCGVRAYCPRCPAWSELEAGNLTEPAPYLCEIAKARKKQYG